MFAKNKKEEIQLGPNDISIAKEILPYTKTLITRQRSFVSYLGMMAVFEKFKKLKLESTFSYTLANNAFLLNEFDVADLWVNGVKVDVRVSVSENITQIAIPKSHLEYNIAPDIYIAVNFNKYLDEAEILGFIKTSDFNLTNSDDYSYFVNVEELKAFDDIKKTIKGIAKQEKILNVAFGDIAQLFLPYIDGEIEKEQKRTLLNALSKSIEFMDAFNTLCKTESLCSSLPKSMEFLVKDNPNKDYTLGLFAGAVPVVGPEISIDISDDIHHINSLQELLDNAETEGFDLDFFDIDNKDKVDEFLNQDNEGGLKPKKKLFKTLNGMFKETHEEVLDNENFEVTNLDDALLDFVPVENSITTIDVPESLEEEVFEEVSFGDIPFMMEESVEPETLEPELIAEEQQEDLFAEIASEPQQADELIFNEVEEDLFSQNDTLQLETETSQNSFEDIFQNEDNQELVEEGDALFLEEADSIKFEEVTFEEFSETPQEEQQEDVYSPEVETIEIAEVDALDFLSGLADETAESDEDSIFEMNENPQGVQIAGTQESFSDEENVYEINNSDIDDIFKNSKISAQEKRQVVDPKVMELLLGDKSMPEDLVNEIYKEKIESGDSSSYSDFEDGSSDFGYEDLASEPVSINKMSNSKIGIAAALLATAGIAYGVVAWKQNTDKAAMDAMALQQNGMNSASQPMEPGMMPSNGTTAPTTPSADVNQSLANAVATSGDAVNVRNVQWEVNSIIAGNDVLNKFLVISGRTLKQSLASNLASTTEKATNSFVKINLVIDKTGTVSSKMITGSGSAQVDDTILKTVKETFGYTKMPNAGPEISSINSNLIINL